VTEFEAEVTLHIAASSIAGWDYRVSDPHTRVSIQQAQIGGNRLLGRQAHYLRALEKAAGSYASAPIEPDEPRLIAAVAVKLKLGGVTPEELSEPAWHFAMQQLRQEVRRVHRDLDVLVILSDVRAGSAIFDFVIAVATVTASGAYVVVEYPRIRQNLPGVVCDVRAMTKSLMRGLTKYRRSKPPRLQVPDIFVGEQAIPIANAVFSEVASIAPVNDESEV
jgi:hypothetical protein